MKYNVTYIVGLGKNAKGEPIPRPAQVLLASLLRTYAIDNMGGGTVIPGSGFWLNGDKRITEPVFVIVTDTDDEMHAIRTHASRLADIAHQQCVHVSMHEAFSFNVDKDRKVL